MPIPKKRGYDKVIGQIKKAAVGKEKLRRKAALQHLSGDIEI